MKEQENSDKKKMKHTATPPSGQKSKRRPISRERRLGRRERGERGDQPVRVPRAQSTDETSRTPSERKTERLDTRQDTEQRDKEVQRYQPHREKAMSIRQRRDDRHQRKLREGVSSSNSDGSSARDAGAIYLMDLALEKLRLLDYYRHFIVAQNRMRAFTPVEFAVPRQVSLYPNGALSLQEHAVIAVRQEQLSDFFGVCSWLLNSYLACDWKEDDMLTAVQNARGMLVALTDEIGLDLTPLLRCLLRQLQTDLGTQFA